ncbi:nuclear transport factor 2 family protein [Sphingorhabdus pulchriflava]|uniref:Nuclear transport factor 2 family protein n=2 Tax=Sphingorhabdus pulchriflava TaxID=2292257 RepID=A0A371BK30_9SPHN|nr:nuclear transport factor 2 family protein [Sphingorhabdus pulchriflava]
MPDGAELAASVQSADSELFALFFTGCDPEKLRTMVTDTLEFYHDKGGLVATSGAQFVAEYATNCEAKKAPDAWRSRRELVTASLHVDPVPGFGAMEAGEHLFYERKGDGPEKLVGRAGFAMVWQWAEGRWKLHRVLSYGHKPVP